jgi:hypothetical protein
MQLIVFAALLSLLSAERMYKATPEIGHISLPSVTLKMNAKEEIKHYFQYFTNSIYI